MFVYVIHEGKVRAPAAAMALMKIIEGFDEIRQELQVAKIGALKKIARHRIGRAIPNGTDSRAD